MFRNNASQGTQSQNREGEKSSENAQPVQPAVMITGAPVIQTLSDYLNSHQVQPTTGASNPIKLDSSQMSGSFGGGALPTQQRSAQRGEFQLAQQQQPLFQSSPAMQSPSSSCCQYSNQMASPSHSLHQQSPPVQQSPLMQQSPLSSQQPSPVVSPLMQSQSSMSSQQFQPAAQYQSSTLQQTQQTQPMASYQRQGSFQSQQSLQSTGSSQIQRSAELESKIEYSPLLRPHLPAALDKDIVGFIRSRLNHVAWPILQHDSQFFLYSLKPLGHASLSPVLLQQIRSRGWRLRHIGSPLISSVRARLGRDFEFPDYVNQRAAFLAGKPSTESANLLSRDRDYEHGRPTSIADRVKDALNVGHTSNVPDFAEQKTTGTEASGILDSLKARLGLGRSTSGGLVATIKHKLGLDKPRIDASFFESTEKEVNYSTSGGLIDTVKVAATTVSEKLIIAKDATISTVKSTIEVSKEKLSNAKETVTGGIEVAKDKLEIAREKVADKLEVAKDKLEIAREKVADKLEIAKEKVADKLEAAKDTVKDKLGMGAPSGYIPPAPPVLPDRPAAYYGSGVAPASVVSVGYTIAETQMDPIDNTSVSVLKDVSIQKLPDGQSLLKEEVVMVRDTSAENTSRRGPIDSNSEYRLSGM